MNPVTTGTMFFSSLVRVFFTLGRVSSQIGIALSYFELVMIPESYPVYHLDLIPQDLRAPETMGAESLSPKELT